MMKQKNDKVLIVAMAFVAVVMLSVVYAAFTNAITVTGKGNAVGTMTGVTQTVSCTSAVGLSGATAPSASVSTTAATKSAVTVTATLHQPGDKVTCTVTYKNTNGFAVKSTSGTTGCNNVTGSATSPVNIAISKVAANTSLQPNSTTSSTITISFYSAASQGNPTTKTASVACAVAWAQA